MSTKQTVAAWPDGTWCDEELVEEYMNQGFSDDYMLLTMDAHMDPDAIDLEVNEKINNL